jgi:hypothetical protein
MIFNEEVIIDIDCKGETTGKRYQGQFKLKLFLTHREKMKLQAEISKETREFQVPNMGWNINGFINFLNDESEIQSEGKHKLELNEEQKNKILQVLTMYLPTGNAGITTISNIIIANYHITEAPSFWKESNNGLDLLDSAPINDLFKQMNEIKDSELNEQEKTGEEN